MPTRISEPKIFRIGYPTGVKELEQEEYERVNRKMGLQVKERRDRGTEWLCLVLLWSSVGCPPSLATFESWVRRKSVKPGLER